MVCPPDESLFSLRTRQYLRLLSYPAGLEYLKLMVTYSVFLNFRLVAAKPPFHVLPLVNDIRPDPSIEMLLWYEPVKRVLLVPDIVYPAEQLAVVDVVQVHVHGPDPETEEAVPAEQRLVLGADKKFCPLELPQTPATGTLVWYPEEGLYV